VSISKKSLILLTGATGFLGSHILNKLVKNGHNVAILKRSWSDIWRIDHLLDQIKVFNLDLISLEEVFQSVKPEYIIHLATLYSKFDSDVDMDNMYKSNVSFPANLLEIGIKYGLKGFINTGTFFEYSRNSGRVDEKALVIPINLYAKTKIEFEAILKLYSKKINISTLRIFTPYGEKDNFKLIPMIIQKALSGELIELSNEKKKLDFIYISDVVDAYILTLDVMMHKDKETSYNVYNLGSGSLTSVKKVISIIEKNFENPLNISWNGVSIDNMPTICANTSKIERDMCWSAKVTMQQGISNTIEFYKNRL
jgi:UDP-glucose 4-epimerase